MSWAWFAEFKNRWRLRSAWIKEWSWAVFDWENLGRSYSRHQLIIVTFLQFFWKQRSWQQYACINDVMSLFQSAEQWRERVKSDPVLESLGAIGRLRKDQPSKVIWSPPVVLTIDKGLDKFYGSSVTQSTVTCARVEQEELDSVTASSAPR